MSKVLNIPAGISTIGNSLDTDNTIESLANSNIESLKTLTNGLWQSWTVGTPIEFQGFTTLAKGFGYVVNAKADTEITLVGEPLDPKDMPATVGLNMLSFPYRDKVIGKGYISKLNMKSIKTIDTIWKSWAETAPVEFQGFETIDDTKGYVVDVAEVYDGYITSSTPPTDATGIIYGSGDTTVLNGEVISGVSYTDPDGVGAINFDAINFDGSVPTSIMFITINGLVSKIDFPVELNGKGFCIDNNGISYRSVFAENEDFNNPTLINETLEISYDNIVFDNTVPFLRMDLKIGGICGIIEFATEYTGLTFNVWVNGDIIQGTFAEGEVVLV